MSNKRSICRVAGAPLEDKAGLQEITQTLPDCEEEEASLFGNCLQDKQSEQVDSLDDSLCGEEGIKDNEWLVPYAEGLTQIDKTVDLLINGEKNCNLVDELFDELPLASQNTSGSDNLLGSQFEKKIAPLFTSTKTKRFRAPVQSVSDEASKENKQPGDIKTVKAKPVFKASKKPSTGKKQKLSNDSKDEDENTTVPPRKKTKPDISKEKPCKPSTNNAEAEEEEVNFVVKKGPVALSVNSVNTAPSVTDRESLPTVQKVNSKKRKKKDSTDGTDELLNGSVKKAKKLLEGNKLKKPNEHTSTKKGVTKSEKETSKAKDSKKITAQRQAKIDMSCKNLDREQRKAEKELEKINRELQKAKKQKSNEKKLPKVDQSSSSSSSSSNSGQLWVQCDRPDCLKWRRLRDCSNPCEIPEEWYCNMNPDQRFNSCAVAEEESGELSDSQEYVYASYTPGTIVWAKITGYPWWPAMVQCDDSKETFYEKHPSCHTPIAYHVVFFSKPVSRAWVHSLCLQVFMPDDDPNTKVAHKYNKPLMVAMKEAGEASQLSIEERVDKYSFYKLYVGKSTFNHDQWAGEDGDKEARKRKRGAPKKSN